MRSMTGYGRSLGEELEEWQWIVEIQGVNRKMLDLAIQLPKELLRFEMEVRRALGQRLERGQVSLKLTLRHLPFKKKSSKAFLAGLKVLRVNWQQITKELGLSADQVNLTFLLERLKEEALEELPLDEELLKKSLLLTVEQALSSFLEMKEREGKHLGADLKKRLAIVQKALQKIEKEALRVPNKFYHKLKERMEELSLFKGQPSEEERLMREVALYAEKADTTEEITRLYSHLKEADRLLKEREKQVGRSFDFLVQEMQREINTISAKSPTLEITGQTLLVKAELEKMREQIQNIE